jgi:hypothetical protein
MRSRTELMFQVVILTGIARQQSAIGRQQIGHQRISNQVQQSSADR